MIDMAIIILKFICLVFLLNVPLNFVLAFSDGDYDYEVTSNQSLRWGPYRSNCYMGIRPRYINEEPFVMGVMWFDSMDPTGLSKIRHFVDQNDKLDKYAWLWYDPRFGGKQTIIDGQNNIALNFTFVKSEDGKNWALQVEGDKIDKERESTSSVVLYMKQNGEEGSDAFLHQIHDYTSISSNLCFNGFSKELGSYNVDVNDIMGEYYKNDKGMLSPDCDPSKPAILSMNIPDDSLWQAKDVFTTVLGDSVKDHMNKGEVKELSLVPNMFTIRNLHGFPPGRVHFIQKTFNGPFKFNILYNAVASSNKIVDNTVERLISVAYEKFQRKFNAKFNIPSTSRYRNFAEETLSNLMGGLSYFYGSQLVDTETTFNEEGFESIEFKHPEESLPHELFTMVPSRAFFPRGFYWDEGFHLLQLLAYDYDLVFEIFKSWANLIDENGWIARELILGLEARSKVPEQFQVQNPNIANPPTLLLAFEHLLVASLDSREVLLDISDSEQIKDTSEISDMNGEELKKNPNLLMEQARNIYPKLVRHFSWFRRTQRGMTEEYLDVPSIAASVHLDEAYRWVGRTFTHCLPSGMDDYPRAIPPDIAELHVDALSWVGVMARSMKEIATVLDMKDDIEEFTKIETNVIENLETLHWSEKHKSYCDITVDDMADEDEQLRKFVCHDGYVTILPFAVKLIPKNKFDRLEHILDLISDEERIFSPYGLLSLSKKDEFYGTDENYWRGPIWLNINYLCLDALQHYFGGDNHLKTEENNSAIFLRARKIYKQLRKNLIENIFEVWEKDGYCYEQYNERTGSGSGVQHFTGWTALIVNIIGKFPESL